MDIPVLAPKTQGLYLIKIREFVRSGEEIYKIGRSVDINKRITQYPKGSILCMVFPCDYPVKYEKAAIYFLKNTFLRKKEFENEYFEGNMKEIISLVNELLDKDLSTIEKEIINKKVNRQKYIKNPVSPVPTFSEVVDITKKKKNILKRIGLLKIKLTQSLKKEEIINIENSIETKTKKLEHISDVISGTSIQRDEDFFSFQKYLMLKIFNDNNTDINKIWIKWINNSSFRRSAYLAMKISNTLTNYVDAQEKSSLVTLTNFYNTSDEVDFHSLIGDPILMRKWGVRLLKQLYTKENEDCFIRGLKQGGYHISIDEGAKIKNYIKINEEEIMADLKLKRDANKETKKKDGIRCQNGILINNDFSWYRSSYVLRFILG